MRRLGASWAALFALLLVWTAHAAPVRLVVSIGNDLGDPSDAPLRYAALDAERVRNLLVELGGVRSDRSYLLQNQRVAQIREKLAEVRGRISELRAQGEEVVLFVYVSGHAQGSELHLLGDHLPFAELRGWAEGTGANLRVLMVDACDSGAAARAKGGTLAPDYRLELQSVPLSGEVFLSSSGPAEPSQEWDSFEGSLFTHELISGLRGDADSDGDGVVSLAEAYAYAYRRTVATAAGAGQHPTFDMDLSGSGELVLTRPVSSHTALKLPAELEGHFVVVSQPRPEVVIEVDKRAGKALRIAVPPGRYLVRKPEGHFVAMAAVELPYGGERELSRAEMVLRDYREVTLKGGLLEIHPYSVAADLRVENALLPGVAPGIWGGLAARFAQGSWLSFASLQYLRQSFTAAGALTREQAFALELGIARRSGLGPLTAFGGLVLRAAALREAYQRPDEATYARVFGQASVPIRWSLATEVGPRAGVEIPLAGGTSGLLEADLLARHLRVEGETPWSLGAAVQVGFAKRF